jgi:hypothetical protein
MDVHAGSQVDDPFDAAELVRMRRIVNDEIARIGATFNAPATDRFDFVCECRDAGCRGMVSLTLADYATMPPGTVVGHD